MTRRVLVVDDNEAIRLTTCALLEDGGYEVIEAATVASGRDAIGGGVFDAAILDLHLPDGLGTDLIDELRARQPQAAVVLYSGTSGPGEMKGADLVLVKGLPADELLARLDEAIKTRSRR